MTHDKPRNKTIEVLAESIATSIEAHRGILASASAALDALHGIVRVVPIPCTDEMTVRGLIAEEEGQGIGSTFDAMAAAGDITKPEEKK